jgi:integrase
MAADQRSFGTLLRRHRLIAGLTQEELAQRAGLSLRGVSDLERGLRQLPYPDTVARLIAALGFRPSEQDALYAARRRPPPRSPVPAPLTSFIGRQTELSDVERLLDASRLVTLTGAGGEGKTRLALEVARRRADVFQQSVEFVPLAGLGSSDLLVSAMRVAELASLRAEDVVARPGGWLLQVLGKGDVERRDTPLSREAKDLIDTWVLARPVTSVYIFTTFQAHGRGPERSVPTDRPMDASAVWRVVRSYAEAAGLAGVKPHDFRRFVGTQLTAGDIRKAQKALGHKRIDTTARHYVLDELEPGLTDDLY